MPEFQDWMLAYGDLRLKEPRYEVGEYEHAKK